MKVLWASNKPKGTTSHLYNPYINLEWGFHYSLFFILFWWYPLIWWILEKNLNPYDSSSTSSNRPM